MDATATTVFPQFGSASGTGVMNAAAPMVKKLASTSNRLSVAVSINFSTPSDYGLRECRVSGWCNTQPVRIGNIHVRNYSRKYWLHHAP